MVLADRNREKVWHSLDQQSTFKPGREYSHSDHEIEEFVRSIQHVALVVELDAAKSVPVREIETTIR